ncbi:unnamed protein product [Mytilus coruscus]|uniref:Uncharacterized protein n=1 Tax=Mytilus coruscus TaxID=42192 RepID=A0A6J7ZV10_MYTCO|nr:unnamed protein product [Mytilus coruscus]
MDNSTTSNKNMKLLLDCLDIDLDSFDIDNQTFDVELNTLDNDDKNPQISDKDMKDGNLQNGETLMLNENTNTSVYNTNVSIELEKFLHDMINCEDQVTALDDSGPIKRIRKTIPVKSVPLLILEDTCSQETCKSEQTYLSQTSDSSICNSLKQDALNRLLSFSENGNGEKCTTTCTKEARISFFKCPKTASQENSQHQQQ